MDYVIGFAFDEKPLPDTYVLLIKKSKPDWQKGKLNGIGGKIGDHPEFCNETALQAMVREFHEETGVLSSSRDWELFSIMHNGRYEHQVFCFETRVPALFEEARTMEEEPLVRIPVAGILRPKVYPLIPNLRSKIMLALDRESWHRPVDLVYGGQHFAGNSLKEAVALDPKIDL